MGVVPEVPSLGVAVRCDPTVHPVKILKLHFLVGNRLNLVGKLLPLLTARVLQPAAKTLEILPYVRVFAVSLYDFLCGWESS